MRETPIPIRRGTPADVPTAGRILTEAFAGDPLWGWAYPMAGSEPERVAPMWELWAQAAIDHGWFWVTEGCEAISIWTLPGNDEMTDAEDARFHGYVADLCGDRAPEVLTAMEGFAEVRPTQTPHYYLSLLATANAHRGHGLGIKLLRAVLEQTDAEGVPVYLESSNTAANDTRYERLGFRRHGEFVAGATGITVHTMLREPGAG